MENQEITLENALNINERETYIQLMPKWLAELELIEKLTARKKEIEKKVNLAMVSIGEFDCDIYKISKKTTVEEKIIDSKDTVKNINDTFAEMKKMALENNDTNLLNDIEKVENSFEEDKTVSYKKPKTKIKEIKGLVERMKQKFNNNLELDKVVSTNVKVEHKLEMKKHILFEKETEDIFFENQNMEYVS